MIRVGGDNLIMRVADGEGRFSVNVGLSDSYSLSAQAPEGKRTCRNCRT